MSTHKDSIVVMREEEKQLYRIMKDLESKGESIIEKPDPERWKKTAHKLGHEGAKLIDEGYLYPILSPPRFHSKASMRVIKTTKNTIVEEIKRKDRSEFWFKWKK